jgi:hypothetical protein
MLPMYVTACKNFVAKRILIKFGIRSCTKVCLYIEVLAVRIAF